MSWSELERLVDEAEREGALRRALSHCRSRQELVLAARRLGYTIEAADLQLARRLHRRQGQATADPGSSNIPVVSSSRCG